MSTEPIAGGISNFLSCPFCEATLLHDPLSHLSAHGAVGIRWDRPVYRCACGFEGPQREMKQHWVERCRGDAAGRKHAALCALGDLGGASPFHTVDHNINPYAAGYIYEPAYIPPS